ncbi:MAG: heavy metal translocating P-type ATPase [Desulfobacterales bacterium]|nr:MAG: heavy metal translocating P-type ATPase [Desulfobacterales bacterium]
MFKKNRKKTFAIRHDIPGRLRLRIPELHKRPGAGSHIHAIEAIEAHSGVDFVRVNPKCASLVLRYDPKQTSREAILAQVGNLFSSAGALQIGCDTVCYCQSDAPRSTGTALKHLGAVTAVVAGTFIRTSLMGLAVAETLVSPLGLTVVALSLPLIIRGYRDLKEKRPSLDAFLAGGVLASVAGGEAVTALEILWINSGAETLSTWIAERSRRHISEILDLTSHHTFVLIDGIEVEREIKDLIVGDIVVLHTGEKISVDGEVVHGEALVNEAPVTGRGDGVHKKIGDKVFAGTFVAEGLIRVKAESVGDATYLSRIMHKVQNELESRAPIEGVADRLASRLVTLGFLTTAATWVITGSLYRAYTVLLIMACPCATVLAASTAVSAAMNAAARHQILIKGGRYLEEIGKCETVFFDKTGTLTTTEPVLQKTVGITSSHSPVMAEDLLQLAASAEAHNHHPLAQAIVAEARRRGVAPLGHSECDYHMGMGMCARVDGAEILVGNAKLAKQYNAPLAPLEKEAAELRARGLTVLYVHKDRKLQGLLGFSGKIRPDAAAAITRLRELGVKRMALITGDEPASSERLAAKLGIEACLSSLMPEEKAEAVVEATEKYGAILMVGDGINDALALTRSEVGVAFGTGGSEVAVEAADVALARDDLRGLVAVYEQSRKTVHVAYQNFWLATGSNLVGVVLGGLGLLTPVTAGLVHIGHSLGVLANSSRLLRLPEPQLKNTADIESVHKFQYVSEIEDVSVH